MKALRDRAFGALGTVLLAIIGGQAQAALITANIEFPELFVSGNTSVALGSSYADDVSDFVIEATSSCLRVLGDGEFSYVPPTAIQCNHGGGVLVTIKREGDKPFTLNTITLSTHDPDSKDIPYSTTGNDVISDVLNFASQPDTPVEFFLFSGATPGQNVVTWTYLNPEFFVPQIHSFNVTYDDEATQIPEPASLALLGAGFLGLRFGRWRRGAAIGVAAALTLAGCAEQAAPPATSSTPSAPAASTAPAPAGLRDLSGEWRFNMGGKVAITQTGDRVRGTWSQGNDRCSSGTLYLDAQIQGSKLVGSRIDCTRQDRLPLTADITPDGNAIAFDIPGVGRVGLSR